MSWEWNNGTDILMHHGIKGQKWGVRRYQNPDGTLTALGKKRLNRIGGVYLKAGSKVQRISSVDEDLSAGRKDGSKHAYVSFLKDDNYKYLTCAQSLGGTKFTYEAPFGYKIDIELTNDIVAPDLKTSVDTAIEMIKDQPIKSIEKLLINKTGYEKSRIYKDAQDFVDDITRIDGKKTVSECQKRAYLHYSRNLMSDKKLRTEFFNRLKEKGFNAVVDYNDVSQITSTSEGKLKEVPGFSKRPLIIFDTKENTRKISSTKINPEMLYKEAHSRASKVRAKETAKLLGGLFTMFGGIASSIPISLSISPEIGLALIATSTTIPTALFGNIKGENRYEAMERWAKKMMGMQKNDPVAYNRMIKEMVDDINSSKELSIKMDKQEKAKMAKNNK